MKPQAWIGSALLVLSLLAAACAPPEAPPAPAILTLQIEQPIRNGTREPQVIALSEGQQLAIGWIYDGRQVSGNFCTGTAIAPDLVITAAHCTAGSPSNALGFGVGLLPTDPAGYVRVAHKYEHPSLDATLLVLEQPITQLVPGLIPIPANTEALTDAHEGRDVEAAGFGETYDRTRTGRYFARVELERVANTEIVVNGNGEQGICFGDSGGPVMSTNTAGEPVVLAVESWGDESCVGRDHLTRLDILEDWISAIARGEPPPDPCQGLDFHGRCTDDNVSEWCQDGRLVQRDCEALGASCGYANDRVGYTCTCGEITYYGDCDGDTARYCDRSRLVVVDCATRGLSCGLVDEETGYYCTDTPTPEPEPACAEGEARCEGDRALNCRGGAWEEAACGDAQPRCELSDAGATCAAITLEPVPEPEPEPEPDVESETTRNVARAESGCAAAPGTPSAALPLLGLFAGVLGWGLSRR